MAREIPIFRRDGSMHVALVDDADYASVLSFPWRVNRDGYAMTLGNHGKPVIQMHRLVLGLRPLVDRRRLVDHINGHRLDNRRSNLRIVTVAENTHNRLPNPNTSSGLRGVTWHKRCRKWQASVGLRGRKYYLGLYHSKEEAALAASTFRAQNMPMSSDALAGRR